jgi:hypothetical protein
MELETPIQETPRDRFQYVVTVLILLTTILGAIVALLQTNASVHEGLASRQTLAMAVQLMGELQRSSQRSAYEIGVVADYTAHSMDVITLQATALELEGNGQSDEAAAYWGRAQVLEAQAEALRSLSVLYTDPRYAPQGDEFAPNAEAYADDQMAPILELLEEQNAAVDTARQWGSKADAYTSVITILAVTLFLYGLSLIIHGRVRYIFAIVGTAVAGMALLWTGWTFLLS